jgi:hypothetical protein
MTIIMVPMYQHVTANDPSDEQNKGALAEERKLFPDEVIVVSFGHYSVV